MARLSEGGLVKAGDDAGGSAVTGIIGALEVLEEFDGIGVGDGLTAALGEAEVREGFDGVALVTEGGFCGRDAITEEDEGSDIFDADGLSEDFVSGVVVDGTVVDAGGVSAGLGEAAAGDGLEVLAVVVGGVAAGLGEVC